MPQDLQFKIYTLEILYNEPGPPGRSVALCWPRPSLLDAHLAGCYHDTIMGAAGAFVTSVTRLNLYPQVCNVHPCTLNILCYGKRCLATMKRVHEEMYIFCDILRGDSYVPVEQFAR